MVRETLATIEREIFFDCSQVVRTREKKRISSTREVCEKRLVRGLISRWWFVGLNIPSLVSSYRERREKEEEQERENGAKKIETVVRACIHTFILK